MVWIRRLEIDNDTGANLPNRVLPDVSLNSALHDPYLACVSTPTTTGCTLSGNTLTFNSAFGGTSVSSPSFAGIMAIINQKIKNDHPTQVAADDRAAAQKSADLFKPAPLDAVANVPPTISDAAQH